LSKQIACYMIFLRCLRWMTISELRLLNHCVRRRLLVLIGTRGGQRNILFLRVVRLCLRVCSINRMHHFQINFFTYFDDTFVLN
jgi:hypothetical protein